LFIQKVIPAGSGKCRGHFSFANNNEKDVLKTIKHRSFKNRVMLRIPFKTKGSIHLCSDVLLLFTVLFPLFTDSFPLSKGLGTVYFTG